MSDQPLPSTGAIRSSWVDACETCLKETMRDMGTHPTGEQVRQMRNIARDLFDQWINQRDRRVKAKALTEAAEFLSREGVLWHGDSGVTVREGWNDHTKGQPLTNWLRDRAQQLTEES